MAYGDKYQFVHNPDYGGKWRHTIQEDGYTGNVANIDHAKGFDDPVKIVWNGNKGKYTPIIPSYLELTLMVENHYDFRDLVTSDNRRFRIISEYYNGNTWLLRYKGYLVPDLYKEKFSSTPYPIKLKFIDGLGLLKNMEYPDIASSRVTILSVIQKCLNGVKTIAGDEDIAYCVNIHETSKSMAVFEELYVNERAYKKGENNTQDTSNNNKTSKNETAMSRYDVLSEICKAFAARLHWGWLTNNDSKYLSDAMFIISAPNFMGQPGNATGLNTFYGNKFSSEDIDVREQLWNNANVNNLNLIGDDADLDFYQPTSEVLVDYKTNTKDLGNIIPDGDMEQTLTTPGGVNWPYEMDPDFWEPRNTGKRTKHVQDSGVMELPNYTEPEYVESKLASFFVNKLVIRAKFRINFNVETSKDIYPLWGIIIYDNNSNDVWHLSYKSSGFFWKKGTGTQAMRIRAKNNHQRDFKLEIDSPVKDGSVKVHLYGAANFQAKDPNNSSQQITVQTSPQYEFFHVGLKVDDVFEGLTDNSKVDIGALTPPKEIKTLHSDGGDAQLDLSSLAVDNSSPPTNTANWNIQNNFTYNSDLRHSKILAREVLKGYDQHYRRLKGKILNNNLISVANMMLVDEGVSTFGYLFYKFKYSLQNSQVDFEAFQTLYNTINESFTDNPDKIKDYIGPDPTEPSLKWKSQGGELPSLPDSAYATDVQLSQEEEFVKFDPCENPNTQHTITLRSLRSNNADTDTPVKITVVCVECTGKTVTVEPENSNDGLSYGNVTSWPISLTCGKTYLFDPYKTRGGAVGWTVTEL